MSAAGFLGVTSTATTIAGPVYTRATQTVRYWSVYAQTWTESHPSDVSDRELAAMPSADREIIGDAQSDQSTKCEDCGRVCESVGDGGIYLIREVHDTCSECYGATPVMDARLDVLERC